MKILNVLGGGGKPDSQQNRVCYFKCIRTILSGEAGINTLFKTQPNEDAIYDTLPLRIRNGQVEFIQGDIIKDDIIALAVLAGIGETTYLYPEEYFVPVVDENLHVFDLSKSLPYTKLF